MPLDRYKLFISRAMKCIPTSLNMQERLSIAARLYRLFNGNCTDMECCMTKRKYEKRNESKTVGRKDAFKISKQDVTLRFSYERD
jgi:hypothetical protein